MAKLFAAALVASLLSACAGMYGNGSTASTTSTNTMGASGTHGMMMNTRNGDGPN